MTIFDFFNVFQNMQHIWSQTSHRYHKCHLDLVKRSENESDSLCAACPDRIHSLGRHWHLVGNILGPTLTNDVSSTSFYLSAQRSLPTVGSMLVILPKPNKPCLCQHNANHSFLRTLVRHNLRQSPKQSCLRPSRSHISKVVPKKWWFKYTRITGAKSVLGPDCMIPYTGIWYNTVQTLNRFSPWEPDW